MAASKELVEAIAAALSEATSDYASVLPSEIVPLSEAIAEAISGTTILNPAARSTYSFLTMSLALDGHLYLEGITASVYKAFKAADTALALWAPLLDPEVGILRWSPLSKSIREEDDDAAVRARIQELEQQLLRLSFARSEVPDGADTASRQKAQELSAEIARLLSVPDDTIPRLPPPAYVERALTALADFEESLAKIVNWHDDVQSLDIVSAARSKVIKVAQVEMEKLLGKWAAVSEADVGPARNQRNKLLQDTLAKALAFSGALDRIDAVSAKSSPVVDILLEDVTLLAYREEPIVAAWAVGIPSSPPSAGPWSTTARVRSATSSDVALAKTRAPLVEETEGVIARVASTHRGIHPRRTVQVSWSPPGSRLGSAVPSESAETLLAVGVSLITSPAESRAFFISAMYEEVSEITFSEEFVAPTRPLPWTFSVDGSVFTVDAYLGFNVYTVSSGDPWGAEIGAWVQYVGPVRAITSTNYPLGSLPGIGEIVGPDSVATIILSVPGGSLTLPLAGAFASGDTLILNHDVPDEFISGLGVFARITTGSTEESRSIRISCQASATSLSQSQVLEGGPVFVYSDADPSNVWMATVQSTELVSEYVLDAVIDTPIPRSLFDSSVSVVASLRGDKESGLVRTFTSSSPLRPGDVLCFSDGGVISVNGIVPGGMTFSGSASDEVILRVADAVMSAPISLPFDLGEARVLQGVGYGSRLLEVDLHRDTTAPNPSLLVGRSLAIEAVLNATDEYVDLYGRVSSGSWDIGEDFGDSVSVVAFDEEGVLTREIGFVDAEGNSITTDVIDHIAQRRFPHLVQRPSDLVWSLALPNGVKPRIERSVYPGQVSVLAGDIPSFSPWQPPVPVRLTVSSSAGTREAVARVESLTRDADDPGQYRGLEYPFSRSAVVAVTSITKEDGVSRILTSPEQGFGDEVGDLSQPLRLVSPLRKDLRGALVRYPGEPSLSLYAKDAASAAMALLDARMRDAAKGYDPADLPVDMGKARNNLGSGVLSSSVEDAVTLEVDPLSEGDRTSIRLVLDNTEVIPGSPETWVIGADIRIPGWPRDSVPARVASVTEVESDTSLLATVSVPIPVTAVAAGSTVSITLERTLLSIAWAQAKAVVEYIRDYRSRMDRHLSVTKATPTLSQAMDKARSAKDVELESKVRDLSVRDWIDPLEASVDVSGVSEDINSVVQLILGNRVGPLTR